MTISLSWACIILSIYLIIFACSKKEDGSETIPLNGHCSYIICQGAWGLNNGSVSIYDWENKILHSIQQVGDVLNQGILDGDNLYLASYGNNSLVVLDIRKESVSRNILLDNAGPQALGLAENKIYIAADNIDSILILDKTTLEKKKSLPAGDDPGSIAVYGRRVFVANYGYDHYDADTYTSYYNQGTVTVIDASQDLVLGQINVGMNPSSIITEQDLIYVLCTGDYSSHQSWIYRINPATLKVIDSLNLENTGVTKIMSDNQGNLYSVAFSFTTFKNSIISYDRGLSKTSIRVFLDFGDGIAFAQDRILISRIPDFSSPGMVYALVSDLTIIDSVQVGIGPSQIITK